MSAPHFAGSAAFFQSRAQPRRRRILHNLPHTANNSHVVFNRQGRFRYESNRNRSPQCRPWTGRYPQGNPPHPPYPRGRPVADSIDTVGAVLCRNGRFGQTKWVELVHNAENESCDRRYPRRMNHGNESSASIARQWMRTIYSVPMRPVRAGFKQR